MWLNNKILSAPLVLVFLGIVIIAGLYSSTFSLFHLRWSEESSAFSHGYLLVPLSLWLVGQEWIRYRPTLNFEWLPILLIGGLSFSWFAGRVVSVEFVEQSAVILLWALLVPAVIGYKYSFRILLPFLFLFTTIPIIERLAGETLQILAAVVSGVLLNISGVRTFQDGYLLMIPAGSFVVEQSCSGIRYQIAAISLALIDAYLSRMAWRYYVVYVVLAILTAFIANSIRILIIVYAAQVTNMQTSLVDDHLWLGWVLFAMLMPVLVWGWHKYVAFDVIKENSHLSGESTSKKNITPKNIFMLFGLLTALALGPTSEFLFQKNQVTDAQLDNIPDFIVANDQWQSVPVDQHYWLPDVLRPDVSLSKRYTSNKKQSGEGIDVFSGYYANQNNDREAINVVNKVFSSKVWSVVSKNDNVAVGPDGFRIEETLLRRSGSTDRLVWRWFNVGGKSVSDQTKAKMYNFTATLSGRPDITTHIVAMDVIESKSITFDELRVFVEENESAFTGWVKLVRSRLHNNKP